MIHTSHHCARSIGGTLLLALTTSACADAEPAPGALVGAVPVPAAQLASMGEIERESLADLIGVGSAIASGAIDSLIAPVVEQEITISRLGGLPYHLAAEGLGMDGPGLERVYASSPEWELTVRHMVRLVDAAAPAERRESARSIAAEVAARAGDGADFAALAAEFSDEPGAAERGGLLQPGQEGSWVQPFWEAAVQLQPGQASGVVETPYGYHVLYLESRRPLPFQEASRTRLLQRVISLADATAAMESWAAESGAVLIDGPSLTQARLAIGAGVPPSDTLVVARGVNGITFTGDDLVAAWARLQPDTRSDLEAADEISFANWLEDQARSVIWGKFAESIGVDAARSAEMAAPASWRQTIARWGSAAGFREEMPADEIYTIALQTTLSGVPEARATRDELRSFRPRLRALYPIIVPTVSAAN